MSIRIEIFDGTTPMLEKIRLLSHGMALEMLSVAGSHLQREARKSMRRQSHNWHQLFRNGKIVIKKADLRELGLRISHSDGSLANPNSMSNMITSYLMEKSMTVVIGGKHKSFVPNSRDGGVVTGKRSRVNAVSKSTHSILHKLNFGERNEHHTWGGKKESMARFANAKYKGYDFMEQGYSSARSDIVDAMTRRYESLLHKAVNRADIKVRRRSS